MIKKGMKWFSIAFTLSFLLVAYTPLANLLARPLVVEPEVKKADIVVVLGGGAYRNGVLGTASNERMIQGMLLYRAGYAPGIIFAGGTILEPSKKIMHSVMRSDGTSDTGVVEAGIMKETAERLGLPEADIGLEAKSTNTYENLREVKAYMAQNGLKTCLLVTSPTHMMRATLIAKKLGLACYPAPVKDYTGLRTSAIDRLALFREVMWEYAGLVLYRFYGYI